MDLIRPQGRGSGASCGLQRFEGRDVALKRGCGPTNTLRRHPPSARIKPLACAKSACTSPVEFLVSNRGSTITAFCWVAWSIVHFAGGICGTAADVVRGDMWPACKCTIIPSQASFDLRN